MKKLFLGFAACAMLCACTSDDLVSLGESAGSVFDGDMVYMTVNIKDVGSSTRATSGGYKNGSASEYAINSANFYFYDSNGELIASGDAVSESGQTGEDGTNVEYESETVVAVSGLTEYPDYMVTVINAPEGFRPGNSLTELAAVLTDADGIQASGTDFVMSTSSYEDSGDDRTGYLSFVTKVDESYFREEPVRLESDYSEDNPAVDVFVERLAAKVVVGLDEEITDGDGGTLEKTTIGGYPAYNVPVGTVIGLDEDSKVEIALLGWKLNGTSRESYIMKNISDGWTENDLWTGWNSAGEYRSFWGMSPNYGQADGGPGELYYPESAVKDSTVSYIGNTDADEADESARLNKYLKYSSLKNPISFNNAEYCAENTNTTSVLDDESSTGITSALVLAQAYVDEEPVDLVSWHGSLYTVDKFLDKIAADASEHIIEPIAKDVVLGFEDISYIATAMKNYGISSLENLIPCLAENKMYVSTNGGNPDQCFDPSEYKYMHEFDGSYLSLVNHGDGNVGVRLNALTADGYYTSITGRKYVYMATVPYTSGITGETVTLADIYEKEGNYTLSGSTLKFVGEDDANVLYSGENTLLRTSDGVLVNDQDARILTPLYFHLDKTKLEAAGLYELCEYVADLKSNLGSILGALLPNTNPMIKDANGDMWLYFYGSDTNYTAMAISGYWNGERLTDESGNKLNFRMRDYACYAIERYCQEINDYFVTHHMEPNYYKNGLMYYASPIQHLNQSDEFAEGNYGVVRNHWYDMSISSISQIGKGIADEDEVIVPQKEILYYLGADVNILSWKTVSQKMTF